MGIMGDLVDSTAKQLLRSDWALVALAALDDPSQQAAVNKLPVAQVKVSP